MRKIHFYVLSLSIIFLFSKCRNEFDINHTYTYESLIDTTDVAKVYIETENQKPIISKLKSDYINCSVKITSKNDSWNGIFSGRIRGRGNSTWFWYEKKPYRIKLGEKSKILGLKKNKDWVLLANYRDPTHLMNTFAFHLGRGLKLPYTNNYRYAEVILNNEYIGLYQITEQVEKGKNRVNVDDVEGILLSLDADDGPHLSPDADDNFWSKLYSMPVCIKYPKNISNQQKDNIIEDFRILEQTIRDANFDVVDKYFDIDVFIDFMIIQEIVYNVEVDAPRSIYMHKEDNNSKWTMGPLWDFDAGFDFDWSTMYTGHNYFNSYRKLVMGTDPLLHINGYNVPDFFTDLFKNKKFVTLYKSRWNDIKDYVTSIYWEETKQVGKNIEIQMGLNAERWPIDKNYKTEIMRMETWISNRVNFLDKVINNYPNGYK